MKVCILSEYFYPDSTGGTGTVLSGLVRHLKDSHSELHIDVITSRNLFRGDHGILAEQEEWEGIHIRRLSTPQPRKNSVRRRLAANMLFTSAAFRSLMTQRKKYDLLLVVTAPPTLPLAARLFSRLTGTPYVYLVYDLYLDMALALNMVKSESQMVRRMHAMQRNWLKSSSKVIVLGRCMRDFVTARYDVAPHQIEVVPIPANLELVRQGERHTDFRRTSGLEGFVVLYAGNFARYQDFDTLLDAAAQLKERRDITFAFVGDGTKREHICARVEAEGLTNVRMFPFVPEDQLSDLLASADVSLVTLEKEIAGLAVPSKFYNILASGRATVALVDASSEVGRVIAETDCGVRVDPENSTQLAEVLGKLADDPKHVAQMGANARRICEQHYSLAHISQRFYSVFQEVALPRAPVRHQEALQRKSLRHYSPRRRQPRNIPPHAGHADLDHGVEQAVAAESTLNEHVGQRSFVLGERVAEHFKFGSDPVISDRCQSSD